jgi:uncharacterized protein DUF222
VDQMRGAFATAEEKRQCVVDGPWDDVLAALAENARRIAELEAERVRLLAEFARLRPGRKGREFSEFAADEVAVTLRWTRNRAWGKLRDAVAMTRDVPEVLGALEEGAVDEFTASVLTESVATLESEQAHAVTAYTLERAGTRNISELRRVIRRAVLKVDPDGAAKRRAVAREDRRVEFTPQPDGMATLWALLPEREAVAIHQRLDAFARQRTPGDERTYDQRRADVFADLMLNRAYGAINATVNVTVPADAVGGTLDPGEYPTPGSWDEGRWRRFITEPRTGQIVDCDSRSYKPAPAMAEFVRARDRYCVFPGCSHRARGCDIDHRIPWPAGRTVAANLNCLCRHHHRMKHEGGWDLRKEGDGYVWTGPGGRSYRKEAEPGGGWPPGPGGLRGVGRTS